MMAELGSSKIVEGVPPSTRFWVLNGDYEWAAEALEGVAATRHVAICRRGAPPLATGDERLAKKESSYMAAPKIDESRWPLVVVDWVGEVTFEEIDDHFDGMRALVERREPFVVVVDMKAIEGQTAKHRQHGGQRLRELGDLASGVVIAAAHVVRSRLVRGALTAVYWIASPPFPTKVFTDRSDAEAWVLAQYGQTHGAPSSVS